MSDFIADPTYSVYQELNGRLVGKYDCKCAAKDVAKFLLEKYGVKCFVTKLIKVEEF